MRREIYLDWAAAASVSRGARDAFLDALKEDANPGSPHAAGVRAKTILELARHSIAQLAGVKRENVIFTSGATEANNLAIRGQVQKLTEVERPLKDVHILYMPGAHASVVESVRSLERYGLVAEPLKIKDGALDLRALEMQLRPETALVCVDLICGETGTRYAVRDIRRALDAAQKEQEEKRGRAPQARGQRDRILLHVDASQAPLVESFELTHLGADLLTLDAQKVGGIRGIGALIRANSLIPLAPIMHGGGQEQGLRPGTESPALAAAFAEALKEAHEARAAFASRAQSQRDRLISQITAALPEALVNAGKEFASHILNLSFPGIDTDYAVMLLSEAGFAVSTKSACETNEAGSRAVAALFGGAEDAEDATARARSTLRISWGPSTRTKDLDRFAQELVRTVRFLAANALH